MSLVSFWAVTLGSERCLWYSFKSFVCSSSVPVLCFMFTSRIMCAFFHISAISKMHFFFFRRWCPTKRSAEGKEMGNENGAQCKSGTLVCTRCRNTYTKQGENNPLALMLQCYFCALCIIHLWENKYCLPFDRPLPTPPIWTHFCISIQLLESFILSMIEMLLHFAEK